LVLSKQPRSEKAPPAPAKSGAAGPRVPLTQAVARALLDHYRLQITDPGFAPTRGLRLQTRDPKQPVAVQRPEMPGDIFLPHAVRTRLKELAPETVVVVPDGPLHGFPLEALLLSTANAP